MPLITRKSFHSSRLTFRSVRNSDVAIISSYLERDKGAMLSWFGMDDLRTSSISVDEKSKKIIDIYKRNSNRKKQMLHVFTKHTRGIIGVVNIWTDMQGNKRVALYLTKDQRRKGLGLEGQIAVLDEISKKNPKISKYVAQVEDPENKASIRMFCSIGFKCAGMRRFAIPVSRPSPPALTFYRPVGIKLKP